VVAQHACRWKVLGAELGLEEYHIKNISLNHPQDVVEACEDMLRKWLQVGFNPTWGGLDDAINVVKKNFADEVDIAGTMSYTIISLIYITYGTNEIPLLSGGCPFSKLVWTSETAWRAL